MIFTNTNTIYNVTWSCSASVKRMWWSCNEYFLQYCYIFVCFAVKYGTEINKIYCYNKCSDGGLEIMKFVKI